MAAAALFTASGCGVIGGAGATVENIEATAGDAPVTVEVRDIEQNPEPGVMLRYSLVYKAVADVTMIVPLHVAFEAEGPAGAVLRASSEACEFAVRGSPGDQRVLSVCDTDCGEYRLGFGVTLPVTLDVAEPRPFDPPLVSGAYDGTFEVGYRPGLEGDVSCEYRTSFAVSISYEVSK